MKPSLDAGAADEVRAVGADPDTVDVQTLRAWTDALRERASTSNLLGPRELSRLWCRHVLESLAYAGLLDRDRPVWDIGSGAGFPGVPLALAGYEVTLVEPRRKRHLWLRYSLEVAGVPGRVLRGRGGQVCRNAPGGCQFVCRAVGSPKEMLRMLRSYPHSGGTLTLRRGPDSPAAGAARVRRLAAPPLDRDGLLVQFRLPEDSRSR